AREDDIRILVDDVGLFAELRRVLARGDARPPLVIRIFLRQRAKLILDDLPQLSLRCQNLFDLRGQGLLLLQLVENSLDFHLGDAIELGVEDGRGLLVIELECFLELVGGVSLAFRFADEPDRSIEIVEDNLETGQDMDSPAKLFQLELETTPNRGEAEIEE